VPGKSESEVRAYASAFWAKLDAEPNLRERWLRAVVRGEAKVQKEGKIAEVLARKVAQYGNPWLELKVVYGNSKGKAYTEEEDRFLVRLGRGRLQFECFGVSSPRPAPARAEPRTQCPRRERASEGGAWSKSPQTTFPAARLTLSRRPQVCTMHRLGYGSWDDMKAEIRLSWRFRFDWFLKSRTAAELQRRCDTLVRAIEKEFGVDGKHSATVDVKEGGRKRKSAAEPGSAGPSKKAK